MVLNPFKEVPNTYVARVAQNLVANLKPSLKQFLKEDIGDGRVLIKFPNLKSNNVRDKFFRDSGIRSFNKVYSNGLREYYGSSSLIVVLNKKGKEEDLKQLEQVVKITSFNEFYCVICQNDDSVERAVAVLKQKAWVHKVDFNFSTIEKVPLDYKRSIPDTQNTQDFKLPERQEAYNVINVPNCTELLGSRDIKIAIFDVGVDLNHHDLKEQSENELHWDAVGQDTNTYPKDYNTHGTLVAGVALGLKTREYGVNGVGSGCALVDYRIGVIGKSNSGYFSHFLLDLFLLIQAFHKATYDAEVDVICCSWGLEHYFETLDYMIEKSSIEGRNGLGLPIVFAAGNEGKGVGFPANSKSVITVAAVDLKSTPIIKTNRTEWGSNYGPQVDLSAVGTEVITTDILGNYGEVVGYENNFNYYKEFNGTSAAAPQVAGCVGLMLSQKPDLTLAEIRNLLTQNTRDYKDKYDRHYGSGILNVSKTINKIKPKQMKPQGNEYSTNIRISPGMGNRSQLLFASQSYGTFYAIYAKITTIEVWDESKEPKELLEDLVKIERIELELINYKGLINMSLKSASIEGCNGSHNKQQLDLKITLQGAVLKNPNTELTIIDFYEIPDQLLYHECNLEVRRELRSLTGHTWQELEDAKNPESTVGGVFDEEFFHKNGLLEPVLRPDYDRLDLDSAQKVMGKLNLGIWCIGTKSQLLAK